MARQTDIKYYEHWRLTSPMAILFIAMRRFRRVVRSVIEIVSLGGLTVVLLRFLDVGLVTAILSYAVALLAFVVISALLSYFVLRIHISNEGLALKSGLIRRTHKVVPWDKIRSVNLESGPIERLFKLTRVSVDTASSMGSEIEIPAMPMYVGAYLKSHVQEPSQTNIFEFNEDRILQDASTQEENTPLYTLRGKDMFRAAMCSKGIMLSTAIGLAFVVAIASNAYVIYYQINSADQAATTDTTLQEEVQDTLRTEIETNINFFTYFPQMRKASVEMREAYKQKSTTELLVPLIVVLVLTIVVLIPSLVIGFLVKAVIFFVRFKDYSLTQDKSKLISEQGLITRKTTTVDTLKVQILKISMSLRMRLIERFDLKVQQSDEDDTIQAAVGRATHQVEVPCVQLQFCQHVAKKVFPSASHYPPLDPRSTEICRFSPAYFFVRLAAIGPFILAAFWLTWWLVMGSRGATIFTLTLAPVGIIAWWQCWRRTGYAFYENFILLRKGFLGHELRVIPIPKLQEIEISQSVVQRLRNLCTLQLFAHSTTYSNDLKIPFMDRAFAERVRDYLLYRIESSKVRWR